MITMKKTTLIATVAGVVLLAAACSSKKEETQQQKAEKWAKELVEAHNADDYAKVREIMNTVEEYVESLGEEEGMKFATEVMLPVLKNAAKDLDDPEAINFD